MKRVFKLFLLIITIICFHFVSARELFGSPVRIEPNAVFGIGEAIIPFNDGFVSVGNIDYNGTTLNDYSCGNDVAFSKFSADGELILQKESYIGSAYLVSGIQTKNGDFIAYGTGTTTDRDYCGSGDGFIVRFDSKGNVLWTYGYKSNERDEGISYLIETNDKNIIFIGTSGKYDEHQEKTFSFIGKLDKNGNLLWEKEYRKDESVYFNSVYEISKNNYRIVGYYLDNLYHNYNFSIDINESNKEFTNYTDSAVEKELIDNSYYSYNSEFDNDEEKSIFSISEYDIDGNLKKEILTSFEGYYYLFNISKTEDGNYLIAGTTDVYDAQTNSNYFTLFTIKLNSNNGNVIWKTETPITDLDNYDDPDVRIKELSNHDILSFYSFNNCVYLLHYNSSGKLLNNKRLAGEIETMYYTDAVDTEDDGFTVLGYAYSRRSVNHGKSDIYIVKYDKNVNKVFETCFGGESWENSGSIIQTSDGGYLVTGRTASSTYTISSNYDGIIIKLDKNGKILWYKVFDFNSSESFGHIIELKDGNFAITGQSDYGTSKKSFLLKIDSNGNEIWRKTDILNETYYFSNLIQLNNGIILIYGNIFDTSINKNRDIIIKIDSEGNIVDQNILEYSTKTLNYVFSTSDDGYLMSYIEDIRDGDSYKSFNTFYKYDKTGNLSWTKKYDSVLLSSYNKVLETQSYFITTGVNTYISPRTISFVLVDKTNGNIVDSTSVESESINFYHLFEMSNGKIRGVGEHSVVDTDSYPAVYDFYYRYDITPKTSSKGTFTVDKKKAMNKEIVTITVNPALGYIFDKVILTDTKGNKTEIKSLTFEMIDDDVEVEVLFKELINPKTGFSLTTILTMIGVLLYFTLRKKRKA